jgi:hypothetical protein
LPADIRLLSSGHYIIELDTTTMEPHVTRKDLLDIVEAINDYMEDEGWL